jgi:hypothetical protein
MRCNQNNPTTKNSNNNNPTIRKTKPKPISPNFIAPHLMYLIDVPLNGITNPRQNS